MQRVESFKLDQNKFKGVQNSDHKNKSKSGLHKYSSFASNDLKFSVFQSNMDTSNNIWTKALKYIYLNLIIIYI